MRRLLLALTGAPPSLEELRRLGILPEDADPVAAWLENLFAALRYHHYFTERLARTFVGMKIGPFLVYRRRRFVIWMAEQLERSRACDEIVRELVAAKGILTSNPSTNFLTVTFVNEG